MNLSLIRPWASRIILVGVVLGGALLIGPQLPHDQELAFAVGPRGAKQLAVSWTPSAESEPQGGFSMNLQAEDAETIRHIAELPNGDYRFDIAVTRAPGPQTTTYVRRVTLEGGATTIHLP